MDAQQLLADLDVQRLETLALADQMKEDRWQEPVLPGARTLHDQVAHILAWDEWAIAVFELSASGRAIPPILIEAARDSDAYNARSEQRFRHLPRGDVLEGLEAAHRRVLQAAVTTGWPDWTEREIPELVALIASLPATPATLPEGYVPMGSTVGGVMEHLLAHERAHDLEIRMAFGIEPHLERFSGDAPADEPATSAEGTNQHER